MQCTQFTLISMGLIMYSCDHISVPHEPISTKFGMWGFSPCSIDIWYSKRWNKKKTKQKNKKFFFYMTTSLRYSTIPISIELVHLISLYNEAAYQRNKAWTISFTNAIFDFYLNTFSSPWNLRQKRQDNETEYNPVFLNILFRI